VVFFRAHKTKRDEVRQAERVWWLKEFAYSDEEIEQIMKGKGANVPSLSEKLFEPGVLAA